LNEPHIAALDGQGVTAGMAQGVRVDVGDPGALGRSLE
jgi:hypothetical protein